MTDKEKEAIGVLGYQLNMRNTDVYTPINYEAIETVLNLIQTQQKEIEKKDGIINNSINKIEKLRQYFSEDLQVEFITILEILKDKKVIDW